MIHSFFFGVQGPGLSEACLINIYPIYSLVISSYFCYVEFPFMVGKSLHCCIFSFLFSLVFLLLTVHLLFLAEFPAFLPSIDLLIYILPYLLVPTIHTTVREDEGRLIPLCLIVLFITATITSSPFRPPSLSSCRHSINVFA
jgi:hypothetical protein